MISKETPQLSIDPIVEEVRAIRDDITKRFNYDIDSLCDYYIERQKEKEKLGATYVSLPPKKLEDSTKAE